MTALNRLDRTRTLLAVALTISALLWASVIAGFLLLVIRVVTMSGDHLVSPLTSCAVVAGLATGAFIIWQNRNVRPRQSVALWLENREPELRYSLVTLVESRHPSAAPQLEESVSRVRWEQGLPHALARRTLI